MAKNEFGEEIDERRLDAYAKRVESFTDSQIDALWEACGFIQAKREKKYKAIRQADIDRIRKGEAKDVIRNVLMETRIADFEKNIAKTEGNFRHHALDLNEKTKIAFIAMSKHSFFFRRHAVKYALEQGYAPISQFGIFDYFVTDSVDRDLVRRANNNLIERADELWVFGPVSDGVLAEIKLFKEKPVRYFQIVDSRDVKEITKNDVTFEDDVARFRSEL